MPNYKKRNTYQTGGSAKPMPPRTMQGMPLATGQRMATGTQTAASQEAQRKRQEMIKRDRARMEAGNRQRAAALEAARKRAYNQATARAQRPVQGPSRAQAARNQAAYNAAMAARQRGSTPARPTVQNLPNYQPRTRPAPSRTINLTPAQRARAEITARQKRQTQARNMASLSPAQRNLLAQAQSGVIKRGGDGTQAIADMTKKYGMTNRAMETGRAMADRQRMQERQRIQQQIAQLQARLRQLGG